MGVHPGVRARRWPQVALPLLVATCGTIFVPVAPERLRPASFESLQLVDREGRPLAETLSPQQTRALWTPLEQLSPELGRAAVAVEDRRFFRHFGLDPIAMMRALAANLRARRVVQGASTLTQQVARMMLADEARARGEGTPRRTLLQKLREAHLALRLERSFDKRAILEAWLNRIPVGGTGVGVTAGAMRYFGRSADVLSLEQSALLIGLPRGPGALRPDRDSSAALARRRLVLRALEREGVIGREQRERAEASALELSPEPISGHRARFGAWVSDELRRRGRPASGRIATTIDTRLEQALGEVLREKLRPLRARGVTSGAIVVIDHTTDELLALIGSADETDPRWGQVHAAFALRQPGRALKPFVYLAALEQGATLASLAADIAQAFPDQRGAYLPENYDHRFHGPVRYRNALAQSLNVAAVDVLHGVGVERAAAMLTRAGLSTMDHSPAHYGLGLALGSLDVQLLELTEAYAMLARGGLLRPTRVLRDAALSDEERRVADPRLAWLIGDVLSDPIARAPQFGHGSVLRTPYWTAVKTGTSKGFRDNLCVGFSDRFTVGVWVGDPAGRPMEGVSGVTGAGPVWRATMDLLHREVASHRPAPPEGLVKASICPLSGARVTPSCPGPVEEWFVDGHAPAHDCAMHRSVRLAHGDGLPVPPGCDAPASDASVQTLMPTPYDVWAATEGRGVPDAVSGACPEPPPPAEPPLFLSPAPDERVRLVPSGSGEPRILLAADGGACRAALRFFVDGVELPDKVGVSGAHWRPTPGSHALTVRCGATGKEGGPVRVRVLP